jgi:sulfur-oxidizing protein SoxA
LAAYERGKKHYWMKRGQLNLSCADCHYYNSGMKARSEVLSPSLGHVTGFPVFRWGKWGELGTLHRRFGGCNANIRAKPFPAQSEEYKDLEFFLSYMSNGLEVNGPSARK